MKDQGKSIYDYAKELSKTTQELTRGIGSPSLKQGTIHLEWDSIIEELNLKESNIIDVGILPEYSTSLIDDCSSFGIIPEGLGKNNPDFWRRK